MEMLFVVGIEMSKVQRRRHCQFEGGGVWGAQGVRGYALSSVIVVVVAVDGGNT